MITALTLWLFSISTGDGMENTTELVKVILFSCFIFCVFNSISTDLAIVSLLWRMG